MPSKKKKVVKEAKEAIQSNEADYHSAVVHAVPKGTMVVLATEHVLCPDAKIKPFLIAQTLEPTDISKKGDHKINVHHWTAEKVPDEDPYCYQGLVCVCVFMAVCVCVCACVYVCLIMSRCHQQLLFGMDRPYQVQGEYQSEICQGSLLWWEEKPMTDPDYSSLHSKLWYSKKGKKRNQTTGR